MPRFCLLVADAACARIFTVEPSNLDPVSDAIYLHERAELVNRGRGHPLDTDHRAAHQDELDRRFAHELAARLALVIRDDDVARAVVIASPHMLANLRRAIRATLDKSIVLQAIALDLTRATTAELHARLQTLGLVTSRAHRSAAAAAR